MADISTYLQAIMDAVYGEQVRGSIHDAIELINNVSEVVLSTGTAVTGPTSSSTGFYDDSLYLNTSTYELWKCTGTNTWTSLGVLKGANGAAGNGIASITKTGTVGLVDTYTITYTDTTTTTFTVTNGADGQAGEDGNKWYRGTAISGKSVNPTVFSGSGITLANPNDFYLNPTEGAVYYCVTGGDASTATWSYDFTMSGGGGGGTPEWADVLNKPFSSVDTTGVLDITSNVLSADMSGYVESTDLATVATTGAFSDLSGQPTVDQSYNSSSTNAQSGVAVASAISGIIIPTVNDGTLTIQQNGTNKATFTANQSTASTANIVTDEWTTTTTVASGSFAFSGLDDTQGYGYEPYIQITGSSTQKNPTATLSTITGAGTASMTLSYTTSADEGASVKLRIVK